MSVSSERRSSGSLVVGPRDYVKISRNRVGLLREKLRNGGGYYGVRVSKVVSPLCPSGHGSEAIPTAEYPAGFFFYDSEASLST
ncbi:hypothetical protein H8526_002425 [Salmonella enterica]|nr:hypothetical protein [Salmonella enterica]